MPDTLALACVLLLLAVHNVVIEHLAWWLYVPANVTTAACLIALASAAGVGTADMGLSASATGPSVGVGVASGLAVASVVVAAVVPATRRLFADRRMDGVGPLGTAYRAAIRIPLGTVVLEEVAFRGVLVALLGLVAPLGWAVVVACVLFGLWHVVPTVAALDVNGLAADRTDRALVLAGTVTVMAGAGLFLCWLRLATGSLAAPAIVHIAVTATATVAAYAVSRLGDRTAPALGAHR